MLARYRIVRGKRPPDDPLPQGTRIDTRRHTKHVLHPTREMVDALLVDATDPKRARAFKREYLALLKRRFAEDPSAFEALAELARDGDAFIGCACPTKRQPEVNQCHTVLALGFMRQKFPGLDVQFPY